VACEDVPYGAVWLGGVTCADRQRTSDALAHQLTYWRALLLTTYGAPACEYAGRGVVRLGGGTVRTRIGHTSATAGLKLVPLETRCSAESKVCAVVPTTRLGRAGDRCYSPASTLGT